MNEKVKKAIEAGDPVEVAWFIGARMAIEHVKPKWSTERQQLAVATTRALSPEPVQEMVVDFLRLVLQGKDEKQAEVDLLEKMLGDEKPEVA